MRSTRLRKFLLGTAAGAALLATAGSVSAQAALALDRFDPAPAGDRMFGVPSPFSAGGLTPHVMLLADYAHDPLVVRTIPANTEIGAVVKNQLFLRLDGGLSLWNRLYVNADIPVALFENGDNPPDTGGQTFTSPSGAKFGDIRLGVRVRLWGEYHDPFQIAVGGYVWLPTAAKDAFVGTGQVRGLPQLILGGRVAERMVWSAAVGAEIQASETYANVPQGSQLEWGAGLGFLLLDNRHLQIGPELYGDVSFRDVQKRTTNAELLFDVRYRIIDDLEIGAGVGPGIAAGIGTPDFRGVFMVAYTPEQKLELDRDHDGILDEADACPDVPGVASEDPRKNGCPLPKDRDGDGIPDEADACPDVKGVASADPKKNGCPPDRDGDGIPDAEDACPDVAGVKSDDPKKNGCPLPKDTDGDGITDDVDACPEEKGPPDPDPKKNGCPRVHVTEKEISILEQVQFDTAKATIKKVSDGLLDEVAGVVKAHPEIKKIEVQGHTDDRGVRLQNQSLSQQRADAVMKALIKRGIDKKRLTAKGYGQDQPIADNTTDEGRQKNRRVQFNILEKQPKAAP
jgi:OOP family OmpA-OmpF porin